MARPPRIEFPNALDHVMERRNRRGSIVLNDEDRWMLIRTLGEMAGRTEIRVHGLEVLGLAQADLVALRKHDWREALIAHVLTERTSIRQDWIAEHLGMGTQPYVSRLASEMKTRTATDRKLKKLKGQIAKIIV